MNARPIFEGPLDSIAFSDSLEASYALYRLAQIVGLDNDEMYETAGQHADEECEHLFPEIGEGRTEALDRLEAQFVTMDQCFAAIRRAAVKRVMA